MSTTRTSLQQQQKTKKIRYDMINPAVNEHKLKYIGFLSNKFHL